MKINLATRLFLSFLAVLLVSAVMLVLVARFELPRAYGRHLGMMEGMMPGGMGPGFGRNGEAVESGESSATLFEGFQSSFNDALLLAGAVALGTALLASILVSRWMVVPLQRMSLASQRIAAGEYTERVDVGRGDEIGALAANFNRMAESLEQAEIRRKRLIADVAHELRTPLTTIKGSIEGLQDGMLPAGEQTYTQIRQEADRLNRLIDDLQELSRVEAGAFVLERKAVRLADLATSMKKRFGLPYAQKGVALDWDLPASLPPVWADEGRLGQVLSNLLANALHYTPAGGGVWVAAVRDGDRVHVSVRDTGEGIPAGQLELVFERFHRVDPSRSRQAGGSGIGLTIARTLVQAHGGRIWAESPGVGQGSTFHCILPVMP